MATGTKKSSKNLDAEIEKNYPGLPQIGDTFSINRGPINKIVNRYIVFVAKKKYLRLEFAEPDTNGRMYTDFELLD